MKAKFIITALALASALAPVASAAASDCELYFAERKGVLDAKIAEADAARQEMESFKAAFLALQEQKSAALKEREAALKKAQRELAAAQQELADARAKLEREREGAANERIKKTALAFAKMKDAAAAQILEQMAPAEALAIMRALEAKKISQILPKMAPEKAAAIMVQLAELSPTAAGDGGAGGGGAGGGGARGGGATTGTNATPTGTTPAAIGAATPATNSPTTTPATTGTAGQANQSPSTNPTPSTSEN